MLKTFKSPDTSAEKSAWTPKNHAPSNQKIYKERMVLIKKWYAAWTGPQRWALLEFILFQLNDTQLALLHTLLHPPPKPKPAVDFTRCLPKALCLRIFSYLDPQSLCRASQVCWYWKYLAESNEIWQEKCLRLGWFLPTPPLHHDYTLWKRHYVECLCQLYWNPPRPPSEEEDNCDGKNDEDAKGESGSPKQRKKKQGPRHTMPTDLVRKPWRDPDPNPSDTHFRYSYSPSGIGLYSRYPHFRLTCQSKDTEFAGLPQQRLVKPSLPLPPTVPPTILSAPPPSLLHPTLLEKIRLDSPSTAHIHLSTRNKQQTPNQINETFYKIEQDSPFPKLPLYFVHKSEGEEERVSERGENSDLPCVPRIKRQLKSSPGKLARDLSLDESDEGSSFSSTRRSVQNDSHQDGLVRQAWVLPHDEGT